VILLGTLKIAYQTSLVRAGGGLYIVSILALFLRFSECRVRRIPLKYALQLREAFRPVFTEMK
jgi:hypothetical protein